MHKHCLTIITGCIILILMLTLTSSPAFSQQTGTEAPEHYYVRAKVVGIKDHGEAKSPDKMTGVEKEQRVAVEITGGRHTGQELIVPHILMDHPGYDINVTPGTEVILYVEPNGDAIGNAYIADYARDKKLLYLAALFVLLLAVIGGRKGIKSIISLAITGCAIFFVLLPLIFKGYDPITTTVLVSAAVTTIILIILGGISAKTISAVIGTTGGVIVAGLLAFIVGTAAHLTGFSDEEMQMLLYIPQQVNFDYKGILFAGMIIGALGAVMDVGMSIASAVEEIKRANPLLRSGSLIRAGMNVGRDIMGTMADTLILAYAGSAMPLMLVFMAYDMPVIKMMNLDLIATEIVRALAGSVGLILAVPITSITAGLLFGQAKNYSQSNFNQ
ncbi:YibE/F family protein [Desulfoscipio sp. XC116]|uniref:YibE/F family protein n=1 Tax=Desulfoscipio sp. XC116 TaxID=3144975 RepID=UPI00325A8DA6